MIHSHLSLRPAIEPLEARIAPALVLTNPLADIVAGSGNKDATIDLSEMFDPSASHPNHTLVRFVTNYVDPNAPTVPQDILIELLDDEAPLTVQNFLHYIQEQKASGNYEGTFFHRAAPGFVLQGGGFDEKTRSHIDVGLEVHNEFDPARSNVRGTLAMAKVGPENGGGPNSATSEFFFNVGNNASNLDNQNGGFTVFARVLSGMEVVDAITALPKINTSSDGTGTPVQNYDSDPDNNPSTPAPAVKHANLIVIENIDVFDEKGDASGITFDLPAGAVTDANGQPSDLVTGKIDGTGLHLEYKPGASGIANVKVEGTKDGMTVVDEFMVTVKPNLVAEIVADPFENVIVGGDTGVAKLRIGNNGAALARTNVNVKFYLSKAGGTDPNGVIFDDTDRLIGEISNEPIALRGGESRILSAKLNIPSELVSTDAESYRVIAKFETAGAAVDQLFTDDDQAVDGHKHTWTNRFGTFKIPGLGSRTHSALTYVESDGDMVTLSLKGKGAGHLLVNGANQDLDVTDTNPASILRAVPAQSGERIALHNVDIANSFAKAKFGNVDLTGFFTAAGGARAIEIGNIESDSTFSLGAFATNNAASVKIAVGRVQDVVFESLMPVGSFRAVDWLDTTGDNDSLSAPSLAALVITGDNTVRGDFQADVTLSGAQPLHSFRVAGLMQDATLRTNGSIKSAVIGGIDHSNIFAGTTARATTIAELNDASDIHSFKVTGLGDANAFVDSSVVARAFQSIAITGVDGQSATEDFGFVADSVKHYVRIAPVGAVQRANLDDPATLSPPGEADRDGHFVLEIL